MSFFKELFPSKVVRKILYISLGFIGFSAIAPIIFTLPSFSAFMDFSHTGDIGSTIDGITAPFIGIAGMLLTFVAFYIQYDANEKQKMAIKDQNETIEKQNILSSTSAFENNLFEFIKLHQTIVSELKLSSIQYAGTNPREGQDGIKLMNTIIEKIYIELTNNLNLNKKDATITAYLYFYYGDQLFSNSKLSNKFQIFSLNEIGNILTNKFKFKYGYGSSLSRYFRNLYQIYKYIDNADYLDKTKNNRYFYSKIIRSILSTDEQNLLYYNILSPMGSSWIIDRLVFIYKPIKNISLENNNLYSPVEWLKSQDIPDFDSNYLYEYFEYYDDKIEYI
jgi:hypothetical protein